MRKRIFAFRLTALGLAAAVALASLPLPATAALVSTESVIAERSAAEAPDAETTRAALRTALEKYGVGPAEAEARVLATSDAEIEALSRRIAEELPAGADSNDAAVVAVVLIVAAYVLLPVIIILLIFA